VKPLPETVEALVAELVATYPPRCIAVGDSMTDAHRYAGAVELAETLKLRLDRFRDDGIDPRTNILKRNDLQ
jgi:hypothetical protein